MEIVFDHVTKKLVGIWTEIFSLTRMKIRTNIPFGGNLWNSWNMKNFIVPIKKRHPVMMVLRRYCMEFSEEREIR